MKEVIDKLKKLSDKNKGKKEYPLGDVLLLNMYEETLHKVWKISKKDIKDYSPSFYKADDNDT